MRWTVLAMLGPGLATLPAGCGDPQPGDVGYEECEDAGIGINCNPVDLCCRQVTDTDVRCKYVTEDGLSYACEQDSVCDENFHCETEASCESARLRVTTEECPE